LALFFRAYNWIWGMTELISLFSALFRCSCSVVLGTFILSAMFYTLTLLGVW
jgi:hypothetical protein